MVARCSSFNGRYYASQPHLKRQCFTRPPMGPPNQEAFKGRVARSFFASSLFLLILFNNRLVYQVYPSEGLSAMIQAQGFLRRRRQHPAALQNETRKRPNGPLTFSA
jgi:hypothetical protein